MRPETSVHQEETTPAEWQARVDLAAVHRLIAHYGWDDLITNHCSMRVPDDPDKMLLKRHELRWTEVMASNLVKVDIRDDLDESAGVNRAGFTLHGGLLQGRQDVNCALHVHTVPGMAIAGLKGGLRMISQEALRFYGVLGYHPYEGLTEDFDERGRLIADLGMNRAMILENHGIVTVGETAGEAFNLLRHLLEAAQIQLMIQSAGEMIEVPQDICEKVAAQNARAEKGRRQADWPACLRLLDELDPGFRK